MAEDRIRKHLIEAMRRLDVQIRASGYEVDHDWLMVIGTLVTSGQLKASDRETILKR